MRSRRPSAFELRRRIVAIACDRLRAVARGAARRRGGAGAGGAGRRLAGGSGEPAAPPARSYVDAAAVLSGAARARS